LNRSAEAAPLLAFSASAQKSSNRNCAGPETQCIRDLFFAESGFFIVSPVLT
jgi:hypothetical protein